jgi:hypothetical protein
MQSCICGFSPTANKPKIDAKIAPATINCISLLNRDGNLNYSVYGQTFAPYADTTCAVKEDLNPTSISSSNSVVPDELIIAICSWLDLSNMLDRFFLPFTAPVWQTSKHMLSHQWYEMCIRDSASSENHSRCVID